MLPCREELPPRSRGDRALEALGRCLRADSCDGLAARSVSGPVARVLQFAGACRKWDQCARDEMARKQGLGVAVTGWLLVLLGTGVLQPVSSVAGETTSSHLQVGPGDAVRLRVWDAGLLLSERDVLTIFSGDYVVDGNGDIFVPRLGSFRVAHRSMAEIEKEIEEALAPIAKQPVVVAKPLIRILIWGAVKEPGAYLAEPQAALSEVLQLSGGPDMSANLEKISVRRGNETVVEGLEKAFREGHSLEQLGVRSGDVIVVPARSHFGIRTVLQYASYLSTLLLLYLRTSERW